MCRGKDIVRPEMLFDLDWSAIAGSGIVISALTRALVEQLRQTFASRQELNSLGERLSALENHCLQMRETANENREQVHTAEREQRQQWERIAEQVIGPLGRITERLEALSAAQAAQATLLDQLCKRLDQAEVYCGSANVPTRRQA